MLTDERIKEIQGRAEKAYEYWLDDNEVSYTPEAKEDVLALLADRAKHTDFINKFMVAYWAGDGVIDKILLDELARLGTALSGEADK